MKRWLMNYRIKKVDKLQMNGQKYEQTFYDIKRINTIKNHR